MINEILNNLSGILGSLIVLAKIIYDNRIKRKRDDVQIASILEKINNVNDVQTSKIKLIEEKLSIFDLQFNDFNVKFKQLFSINSNIENDIRELNELHKYTRFSKDLSNDIDAEFSSLIDKSKIKDEHTIYAYLFGKEKFKQIVTSLISNNFDKCSADKIFDMLKIKSREVAEQYHLDFSKYENLLNREFLLFASKISNVCKTKENGIRRAAFHKEVIDFLRQLIIIFIS